MPRLPCWEALSEKYSTMNTKAILSAVVAVLLLAQNVFATGITAFGALVFNASFENNTFGCIAGNACTVGADPTPSWSSASLPASLGAGASVTYGYSNGTTGQKNGAVSGGTYDLRDSSCINVIRGANNNGGNASSLVFVADVNAGNYKVTVWGPTLNSYGISGATNFNWYVYDGNNNLINSGSGEVTNGGYTVTGSGNATFKVVVTPTNANELGSVFVRIDT